MAEQAPEFFERDINKIQSEIKQKYETDLNKTLQPAQPETLINNGIAYRELLIREQGQAACVSMLVAFATAPILDYLGDLVGVTRLAATPAQCTIRFTLNPGHGDVTIPAGTRVSSADGKVVFETVVDTDVDSADNTADIACECTTDGEDGNGYIAGTISTIIDPLAFVATAANLATTVAGSADETDEALRERIRLAPGSFSVAGPRGAYIYWAKTAHPSIIDVEVTTPIPGTVNIWPLISGGGVTPPEILDAVFETCNDERIRPLTDTVEVLAPTRIDYAINYNITLYNTAVEADVLALINANLDTFTDMKLLKLGLDIIKKQVEKLIMVDGVYNIEDDHGFVDIVCDKTEFAFCTGITITVDGTNEG